MSGGRISLIRYSHQSAKATPLLNAVAHIGGK